ncbi:MAG: pyridoxamine 5'-phosphate oxidase [Sporichthyaceae bacterium]|nr:pyridoxamine 5'-phosphate oxidase [Sporichthyaceae bacterium]
MRASYQRAGLDLADLDPDPLVQFARWLSAAAELPEPNAMILATADAAGRPSARTVLLKGYGPDGLLFFTNHGSRKAAEIAANPYATLLFPWHPIGRQVIASGPVSRISDAESAAYFATRPYDSQIGAWASRQSSVVASRAELDQRYRELVQRWPAGGAVPAPQFWGGYRLAPETVEFWQGRAGRLHDRLRYRRSEPDREWIIERLAP